MKDNTIQLEKDNILRLEIKTSDGETTGEYLEFDLEDISLQLRYQELVEKDKKNREYLRNQLTLINKRQDVKGKKLLTKNEEDTLRALNDFFNKEKDIYNMFLGDRGVEKLLNGRRLGWTSLQMIDDIITQQIQPKLDVKMEDIEKKIKEKYSQAAKRNVEVLTDE